MRLLACLALARPVLMVPVLTALVLPMPAGAETRKGERLAGVIESFECGDNCYLTIVSRGRKITGLCVAKACQPWNEAAEMPRHLVGRKVTVVQGIGKQFDGAGNEMGDFPSFTEVRVGR